MSYKLFLSLALIIVVGCSSQNNCEEFNNISQRELLENFNSLQKNELSHKIFMLGECEVDGSELVLSKFLHDDRVSHHAQHKGMPINYIAAISLLKNAEKYEIAIDEDIKTQANMVIKDYKDKY